MENAVIQKEDDLILSIDTGITKEKYFLLCDSKQIYIKLDRNHYLLLQRLFPMLDGRYEMEQIKQQMGSEGIEAGIVDRAIEFLRNKGLLKGFNIETYSKVEMEMSSRKVFEFNFESNFEKFATFYKVVYSILMFITVVVVIYGIFFRGFSYQIFLDSLQGANNFKWSQESIVDILIVCICFMLSTCAHEFGHITSSVAMGIKPKSFTLLLRMGIIPVFYIKYKGYYSISSLKKIIISLGGMWINVLQMLIFWILLRHYDSWILAALLVYNAGICLSCFTLLGTSDGYFVISTLFNLEGFRWNMLKMVGNVLYKKVSFKYLFNDIKNYIYIVYFLVSYGVTFFSLYTIGTMIVEFLNFDFVSPIIVTVVVFAIIIINAICAIKKFYKSLKKIIRS